MTNAGDQQIIDVAIHENACFSERAASRLVDVTEVFACSIKIRA